MENQYELELTLTKNQTTLIYQEIADEETRIYLLLDELGKEALRLDGGDIAAVVVPHQNAALDVQEEQCGGSSSHFQYKIFARRVSGDRVTNQIRSVTP